MDKEIPLGDEQLAEDIIKASDTKAKRNFQEMLAELESPLERWEIERIPVNFSKHEQVQELNGEPVSVLQDGTVTYIFVKRRKADANTVHAQTNSLQEDRGTSQRTQTQAPKKSRTRNN